MGKNYLLISVASFLMNTSIVAAQSPIQQTSDQQTNPLIDKGGEVTVYIGVFLLIILIAAIVGMFSQRVEHAVLAALGLSLISIAVFLVMNQ